MTKNKKNKFTDVDSDLLMAKLLPSLLNGNHEWETTKNEEYYDREQSGHGYKSSRELLRHTHFENVAFYLTEFAHYFTVTYLCPEAEVDEHYTDKKVEITISIDGWEKKYEHKYNNGVHGFIKEFIKKKEKEMSIVNYWVQNGAGVSCEYSPEDLWIGTDSKIHIKTKGTKPEGADLDKLITGRYFWQPYDVKTEIGGYPPSSSCFENQAYYYLLNSIVEKVAQESGFKSERFDNNTNPFFTGKNLFTPRNANKYIKSLETISSLEKSIPGEVKKLMKLPAKEFEGLLAKKYR